MEECSGSSKSHFVLLISFVVLLAWSAYRPKERFTWALEVAPAVVGVAVAAATYKRFRLTDISYVCIALHAAILIVGGHYTYAEVPLGDWVRDGLGLARNHYDRLGHVAQGFFPAILVREILLRTSPLVPGKWLAFIVTCICLAISASYELIEWWVSLASGSKGDAFLGTQGDIWDTQWDMFLALCGAITAQVVLGKWQEKQIRAIKELGD